jgi:hypothetical protein
MRRSAEQLLEAAEQIDGYRAACQANRSNRAARRDQLYEPASFSPEDSERLMAMSQEVPLLDGVDIVILDASADGGYPHTRPNALVCIPTTVVQSSSDAELQETLAHEAIHLHQRAAPGRWNAACKSEGWTQVPSSVVPPRYWEQRRINPDTMLAPLFAWEDQWVPLFLFQQVDPRSLSEGTVKWFNIQSTAVLSTPPDTFTDRYGLSPSQPEHPYELLAVELSADGVRTKEDLLEWLRDSTTL